jgi:hypothetical protein
MPIYRFFPELIACFPLIRQEAHRKPPKLGRDTQTYGQQGDLTSLLTKIVGGEGPTDSKMISEAPNAYKIRGIQKYMDRYRRIHKQTGLRLFFQNKKSTLKTRA